jgi:hypothetical protein
MYHMKLGRGFQPVKPESNIQPGLFGFVKLPTLAAAPATPFGTQGLRLRIGSSNAAPAEETNIASVGGSIQDALSKLRIVPGFSSSSSSSSSSSVVDASRLRTQSPGADSTSGSSSSSNASPGSFASGSVNDRIQALLRRGSTQQQQQQQQDPAAATQDTSSSSSSSSSASAEPVHASSSSSGSGQLLQNLPQVAMLAANERDGTPPPGTSTAHSVQQLLNPVDMDSLRSAVAAVTEKRLEGRARVMQRRGHSGKLMKNMKAAP